MNNVKDHYDKHLAHFYAWMAGDFEMKQQEQEDFFKNNSITPSINNTAIDLGCGNGLQSISLAKLGYKVIGIDFSQVLLKELKERSKGFNIHLKEGNILDGSLYADYNAELIVCMGDTITHLHSVEEVNALLKTVSNQLHTYGKCILSYRDFSSELINEKRFIPVKSDEHKIHTCFLEYFPTHVSVTDILHAREHGQWVQKISSYKKLRISEIDMRRHLEDAGLTVIHSEVHSGMIYLISQKNY